MFRIHQWSHLVWDFSVLADFFFITNVLIRNWSVQVFYFFTIFFSWYDWRFFSFDYLFKNQLLVSFIFPIVFLGSISFISALIFIISFLLISLGLVCYTLSGCLRCEVRLFIWAFSCFLRYACIAINFPLRTAFAIVFLFDFFDDPLVVW